MARWQRWVRAALAVFVVGFSVAVYFAIRERQTAPGTGAAERLDPSALAESVGGSSQLAKATRQDFTVDFGRALTYSDGRTRFLEGLRVRVPQRSGRDFELTATEGEAREDQSSVEVQGDVRLRSSDGLEATTTRATYDSADEVVRAPDRVAFTRGRMSGSSVGATYDRTRDVLWMLSDAAIAIGPDQRGAGRVEMRAGAAGFARRDRYIRFERQLRIQQPSQVAEAENAMAYLQPDEDVLQMVELRGNSRVTLTPSAAGQLQAMSARDINLHYAEDGATLERATLVGDAVAQLAGAPGGPGRRLAAVWMDVTLAPDGSPTLVAARDRVELTLPAEQGTPGRQIRALSLEAGGETGRGITTARFLDQVEFREQVPRSETGAGGERRILSRSLDAVVKPGFGGIEGAVFGGGVTLTDASIDARSPSATYNLVQGTMQLVAHGGGAGAQVDDARASIEARRIDVTLDGGALLAEGDVRSVLKATSGPSPGTTDARRRPRMLRDDQPVNVTAGHLDYDRTQGLATYTTDARLWQGETAVQGASIQLDEGSGNLVAKGAVRSTWRLADTDPKTGSTERKTTVATAEELIYEDEQRRATYTKAARMNGPEGDLRADRIELYLDAEGDALERVEAYGAVSLQTGERLATGLRLSYFAADERYVMSGNPVRILEQLPAECRETLGRTLTFYRATDSILVDGNQQRRTQTTTGGKCPGATE